MSLCNRYADDEIAVKSFLLHQPPVVTTSFLLPFQICKSSWIVLIARFHFIQFGFQKVDSVATLFERIHGTSTLVFVVVISFQTFLMENGAEGMYYIASIAAVGLA
jgi:hypothetical protein